MRFYKYSLIALGLIGLILFLPNWQNSNSNDLGKATSTPVVVKKSNFQKKLDKATKIKSDYTSKEGSLKIKKNKIDIEIGNGKVKDFLPEMKISKWNNEVSFNISHRKPLGAVTATTTYDFIDEKIVFNDNDVAYNYYDLPPSSEYPEGGYEYEVVLSSKPVSNIVEFDIVTQGLRFSYQGELTQQEIDEGAYRPENIIGSYAVYHSDKKHNKYKTGKAFHIYRPKIIDANNNWVWGELNIQESLGLMTVTVPQTFLDNATYPVIVDPTFGYTTIGGTTVGQTVDTIRAMSGDQPSTSGTIDKIFVYTKNNTGGSVAKLRGVLYLDSDNSLVTHGSEVSLGDSASWVELDVTDASITGSTSYLTGFWIGTNANTAYYDSGSYAQYRDNETYHATNDPPSTLTEDTTYSSREYSIYATYWESAGTNTHSIDLESSNNQYLNGNQTGLQTGNGSRTFEAWVKIESVPTYMTVLSYGTRANYQDWEWYIWNDGKQTVGIYNESSARSNTAVPTGAWHHIAITYDGTTLTFYLDGVADGTTTFTNTPNTGTATGTYIGMLSNGTQYPFDGLIDEVRAWDDVRTQTEISNNKDTEIDGNSANLQGYWRLNNGLLDSTVSSNILTNNNSAVFSTDTPFGGAVRRIFTVE